TTARSTFDRAVLQAAAAVGILVAFKGDLLEPAAAVVLLAAILTILFCLGFAANQLRVERSPYSAQCLRV
ncbi:MAG: hypothetical protein ACRDZO_18465, partial [Egibacteraceae bacterium]